MKRLPRYMQLPDMPATGIFNPKRGFFSVIVPYARTNLITNPSLETNATGYTAVGGSAGRVVGAGYHGAAGLSVSLTNPSTTDGVYYGPVSLTSGTTYVASCKFKTFSPGIKHKFSIATTGGVDLVSYSFIGTGYWQWIWVTYTETSSTSRRIYMRKNDTRTDVSNGFLLDGLQLEACGSEGVFPTTYIDGDQKGLLPNQFPPPYGWNGTPHASTSYRLATTRAGGRVVNLDSYKYKVLAYFGLGLTALTNIATPPAPTDGAQFQATIAQSRQFSVNGFFDAPTFSELQRIRSQLYTALGPDSITPRQPAVLVYQAYEDERPVGAEGRIIASYDHGLEGSVSSPVQESAPISFTQWLPAILAGDGGADLNIQTSVSNANYIMQRSSTGVWSAMGTGANAQVRALAVGPDGTLYAGGDFTSMGGVANTSRIAKWSPVTQAWTALSTGITGGNVFCLAVGPDGTLYAGGNFTTSGGTATANISRWNGTAWSTVGTSGDVNAQVDAMVVDNTGNLYIGGLFSNVAGIAAADSIAKWNGSAWSALGASGLNNSVESLAVGLDGFIYLGGNFTDAGGDVNADRIAKWDTVAFSALSTGANGNTTNALAATIDGRIYAGGSFTALGGVTASIGVWNGGGWAALGSGVNNTVRAILPLSTGNVWAGGDFTTAGGITLPDRIARWNGSAWVASDIDLPGSPQISALAFSPVAQALYVGYSTSGTATAAGTTTVTNNGTARAYPSVVMNGPSSGTSRVYQLMNTLTGKLIYLNLTLNTGETVTLTTSPQGARLFSTFRGDVSSSILPGSSPDFALERGDNTISFFAASSTVTATMQWAIGYQSVDDLTE